MSKIELKNCPFCGAPSEIETHEGTSFCNIIVKCTKCEAEMHKLFNLGIENDELAKAKKELAEKWNKRI